MAKTYTASSKDNRIHSVYKDAKLTQDFSAYDPYVIDFTLIVKGKKHCCKGK